MPFEFVCPFCFSRTKVSDEYLGQAGPCVNCGRHVVMPTRNERGVLIASIQTGVAPKKIAKPIEPRQRAMLMAITLSLFVLLAAGFAGAILYVLPSVRKGMSVAAQRRDLDSMRTIVTALNDYCAQYGTYPTPSVTDAAGKKLYSWRVLILPFLGYEDLHKRFQLDQAWDSPANMSLLREMPTSFASPNSNAKQGEETNYALLIGAGTIFPAAGPMSNNQVTDDPTILLVETMEGGYVWTEPRDIDVGLYGINIGNTPMQSIGGQHAEHVVVMDCKAKGMRLPKEIPKLVLDALVTPTGGEKVDTDAFKE